MRKIELDGALNTPIRKVAIIDDKRIHRTRILGLRMEPDRLSQRIVKGRFFRETLRVMSRTSNRLHSSIYHQSHKEGEHEAFIRFY